MLKAIAGSGAAQHHSSRRKGGHKKPKSKSEGPPDEDVWRAVWQAWKSPATKLYHGTPHLSSVGQNGLDQRLAARANNSLSIGPHYASTRYAEAKGYSDATARRRDAATLDPGVATIFPIPNRPWTEVGGSTRRWYGDLAADRVLVDGKEITESIHATMREKVKSALPGAKTETIRAYTVEARRLSFEEKQPVYDPGSYQLPY